MWIVVTKHKQQQLISNPFYPRHDCIVAGCLCEVGHKAGGVWGVVGAVAAAAVVGVAAQLVPQLLLQHAAGPHRVGQQVLAGPGHGDSHTISCDVASSKGRCSIYVQIV